MPIAGPTVTNYDFPGGVNSRQDLYTLISRTLSVNDRDLNQAPNKTLIAHDVNRQMDIGFLPTTVNTGSLMRQNKQWDSGAMPTMENIITHAPRMDTGSVPTTVMADSLMLHNKQMDSGAMPTMEKMVPQVRLMDTGSVPRYTNPQMGNTYDSKASSVPRAAADTARKHQNTSTSVVQTIHSNRGDARHGDFNGQDVGRHVDFMSHSDARHGDCNRRSDGRHENFNEHGDVRHQEYICHGDARHDDFDARHGDFNSQGEGHRKDFGNRKYVRHDDFDARHGDFSGRDDAISTGFFEPRRLTCTSK